MRNLIDKEKIIQNMDLPFECPANRNMDWFFELRKKICYFIFRIAVEWLIFFLFSLESGIIKVIRLNGGQKLKNHKKVKKQKRC